MVLFSMYKEGHNGCKKKQEGSYAVSLSSFMLAASKHKEKLFEMQEYDYDEPEALDYASCNVLYINDDDNNRQQVCSYCPVNDRLFLPKLTVMYLILHIYFVITTSTPNAKAYGRIGCKEGSWQALQLYVYEDSSCTQLKENFQYGNLDLSSLKVSYNTCTECASWSLPYTDDDFRYGEANYFSPLCSGIYNYKTECDRSCQKAAKIANGTKRAVGGYTKPQKLLAFTMCILAISGLLGVMHQRKKMSDEDLLMEEATLQSLRIKREKIPKIFLSIGVFILILFLLHVKLFTFILLAILDGMLIGYWARLQMSRKGEVSIRGLKIYGGGSQESEDTSTQGEHNDGMSSPSRFVQMS